MTNLISQIYQTEHFSTQPGTIFKLGYQIFEIDNSAAILSSPLMLPEANSLALWFLEPTELL